MSAYRIDPENCSNRLRISDTLIDATQIDEHNATQTQLDEDDTVADTQLDEDPELDQFNAYDARYESQDGEPEPYELNADDVESEVYYQLNADDVDPDPYKLNAAN